MKRITLKVSIITIFVLSGLLLFSGCASPKPVMYERAITGLDFSKYSRDGFLITPGDFHQSYKSLSILRATCYDGYKRKETPDDKKSDIWKNGDDLYTDVPSSSFNRRDFEYKSCKLSELLDYIVESAGKINANGIIKLEITPVKQLSPVNGENQNGILITGLAISY